MLQVGLLPVMQGCERLRSCPPRSVLTASFEHKLLYFRCQCSFLCSIYKTILHMTICSMIWSLRSSELYKCIIIIIIFEEFKALFDR
jgi:hypothetical protein